MRTFALIVALVVAFALGAHADTAVHLTGWGGVKGCPMHNGSRPSVIVMAFSDGTLIMFDSRDDAKMAEAKKLIGETDGQVFTFTECAKST